MQRVLHMPNWLVGLLLLAAAVALAASLVLRLTAGGR